MNQRSTSLGHKRVSSQPTISITWVLEISPSLDDWKIARAVDLWTHQVGGVNIFFQTRLGFSAFIFHPLGRLLLRILHTLSLTVGWWWVMNHMNPQVYLTVLSRDSHPLRMRRPLNPRNSSGGPQGRWRFFWKLCGFQMNFLPWFLISFTKETNHFLGVQWFLQSIAHNNLRVTLKKIHKHPISLVFVDNETQHRTMCRTMCFMSAVFQRFPHFKLICIV